MSEAEAILREVRALIPRQTNRYVDEWKASGKPVVGYFCHYVPREILLAAGALPLRLRGVGSEDSSRGDAYLSGRVCTYVRHVMSLALEGHYDFLDGEVSTNTCDHVRRSADVFVKKTAVPFHGWNLGSGCRGRLSHGTGVKDCRASVFMIASSLRRNFLRINKRP